MKEEKEGREKKKMKKKKSVSNNFVTKNIGFLFFKNVLVID